ncbi:glycosyltransferase family 2 protein, partial [Candidatus Woesearchaeota archaeon CG08_land_8_20_14_0_20_43_7]
MSTISLCMIVKDEEKHLKDCLDSVKGLVDEIIIVDTGSTDDTKNIAKRSNAKVFDFKWCDDFSKARNESLRHATKEWILVLDADEIIDKDDHDKIKRLIDTDEVAFAFDQWSYIDQKEPKAKKNTNRFSHPFYISHRPVRLFRNNLGIRFMNRVHELVEHSLKEHNLKEVKTNIIIHHFGSLKG